MAPGGWPGPDSIQTDAIAVIGGDKEGKLQKPHQPPMAAAGASGGSSGDAVGCCSSSRSWAMASRRHGAPHGQGHQFRCGQGVPGPRSAACCSGTPGRCPHGGEAGTPGQAVEALSKYGGNSAQDLAVHGRRGGASGRPARRRVPAEHRRGSRGVPERQKMRVRCGLPLMLLS